MTTMENQLECFYLDSSFQSASDMLRKCVQDEASPYKFNCGDNPMRQEKVDDVKETARTNDIAIQRGVIDFNVLEYDIPSLNNSLVKNNSSVSNNLFLNNSIEGFTNSNSFIVDNGPGKSSVPEGECPEGFSLCSKTGKCIQKCQGCIYRDNMKSLEFNEKDPCFPEGTYNGITNNGYIRCTCGNNNEYCSDDFIKNIFTTDGLMIMGKKIIMNMGNTSSIDNLFNIDYL